MEFNVEAFLTFCFPGLEELGTSVERTAELIKQLQAQQLAANAAMGSPAAAKQAASIGEVAGETKKLADETGKLTAIDRARGLNLEPV